MRAFHRFHSLIRSSHFKTQTFNTHTPSSHTHKLWLAGAHNCGPSVRACSCTNETFWAPTVSSLAAAETSVQLLMKDKGVQYQPETQENIFSSTKTHTRAHCLTGLSLQGLFLLWGSCWDVFWWINFLLDLQTSNVDTWLSLCSKNGESVLSFAQTFPWAGRKCEELHEKPAPGDLGQASMWTEQKLCYPASLGLFLVRREFQKWQLFVVNCPILSSERTVQSWGINHTLTSNQHRKHFSPLTSWFLCLGVCAWVCLRGADIISTCTKHRRCRRLQQTFRTRKDDLSLPDFLKSSGLITSISN